MRVTVELRVVETRVDFEERIAGDDVHVVLTRFIQPSYLVVMSRSPCSLCDRADGANLAAHGRA